MTDLAYATAAAIARRVRSGRLRAVDALDQALARQERLHGTLNAIVVTDVERARKVARRIDRAVAAGRPVGPLAGVPMTVKEAFDVAGMPTTWGRTDMLDNVATRDAAVVERLEAAGAVIWGKSNVPVMLADWQTFNPIHGTTHNPWMHGRTPGGSSGGSAAALAAGITPLEYGSDIGGSIRGPSHMCGIVGHKTTPGLVPARGHALPGDLMTNELGIVGPMARSARDAELLLRATMGPDGPAGRAVRIRLPRPRLTGLRGLRVALLPEHPATRVSRAVSGAIEDLGTFLARKGAKVVRAELPFDAAEHDRTYLLLRRAATSMRAFDDAGHRAAVAERDRLDPADHSHGADQLRGSTLTHRDWMLLENERQHVKQGWERFFADHDVLLCPGAADVAFPQNETGKRWERIIEVDGVPMADVEQLFWMGFANMGNLPATQTPIGITASGLPTSVQVIGPQFGDLTTLRVAQLLEREYYAFTPPPGLA